MPTKATGKWRWGSLREPNGAGGSPAARGARPTRRCRRSRRRLRPGALATAPRLGNVALPVCLAFFRSTSLCGDGFVEVVVVGGSVDFLSGQRQRLRQLISALRVVVWAHLDAKRGSCPLRRLRYRVCCMWRLPVGLSILIIYCAHIIKHML